MVGRPAVPEVIWARPERAGRGPKPAFSRADIAAAAVRIADAEGLDAVSMRKVAAELGCGTMSLYNYVPRKEDLHELMLDAVSAGYEYPDPSGDWRADLLALAHQARGMMHRHTWVPRLMSPVYGFSPNALRYLEYALSCLDGVDARFGEKMELIAMLNGVVTTYTANEIATAERSRSLPWSEEQEQAARTGYLISQIMTGKYPRMAAGFAEDPGPIDLDAVFDRALARVLDSFASA
ncbi:TetR/AcrR family transcriptional regulator C-terminal domain-containing protein [Streptomyces poriferorum]|uniref:TetR/AcrR family transcriptional regulator C-terminal domain-containing protein n=1 Tax=Streptomyces poriferorum TaxID=2798799 RepID=A0ABY9IWP0_9ACTN|nr:MULTISPECIES: TetR/AcrR family transcriptional regulator C-terminal domain-containing protein [unclassified Streptomyces]MDP5310983.1 TetR/AcrR family transcriptional regulator C-terminal domain-containing protein [Streptomyces sp. Alt4]WLQ47426.1 TetR/AcrR family transcriptional regulator C-terminal domain-containing protein [Streptomyces sp. Alt1]WLQ59885.1 TetR/AcrR family transcriptional regulator C-terminal domain-containing protein [Streptomyces sp. Alt2]WSI62241.1 TetR/AcrR family tra